ncbi:phage tail tube protein [Paenibacillus flagellatus]|uniref:Phage portal protein n=1 Tax=Paenibacillus flagellatus TaxID=2211139 RepID=A0A2V5KDK9_9BACL|nr:phage tail tube protein [Paenibacillus flagellatus]PYI57022.1 phage portal protein [Paenibacillus flagellatus]
MSFLRAQDTISGQEGRAYATITTASGQVINEEMFYIKSLEATIEKEKSEVKTLGRRGTQHKATGWTGTGSMTIYYVTSTFRQIMYDYIEKGIDTYFDIVVTNEDQTSSVGPQTVVLKNVNLDSVVIAKLDTESETLDEDIDFTFDGVELPETFKKPVSG